MESRKVLKASFWYTVSSILLKGIGFITTPIFARILTKAEYGSYSNIITWYSIITIIATLSLNSSLARARFEYKDDLDTFISSNLIQGSIMTVIVGLVMIMNLPFFCSLFVVDKKYIFIMLFGIVVSPAYDMFLNVQRFNYKYILVVILSVVITLSSVLLSLLLISVMEDNLLARVLGTYFPSFVIAIILYFQFLFKSKRIKFEYCKYALIISVPYIFHLLSGIVLNSSDKNMITKLLGSEDNALYSMAYTVAMIVSIIWSSLDKAFSPWIGEKLNEKKYDSINKYSKLYVLVFLYFVVGIMLLAPEVLYILGGKPYIEAKYAMPPIMVGYLFIMIYSLYVNVEQYEKKTLGMAIATSLAAVINIITNAIFIPKFGYLAASYTTLACDLLMVIFHYFIVRKMKLSQIYDTGFNFIVIIFSLLLIPLCLAIYDRNILRYSTVLAYAISFVCLFLKYKTEILEALKQK